MRLTLGRNSALQFLRLPSAMADACLQALHRQRTARPIATHSPLDLCICGPASFSPLRKLTRQSFSMVFADDHALYVEITGDGGLRMRRINTGDGDRKRPTPGSTCLISYSVVPPEEQGAGGRVDKHVHESFVLGHPDVPLAIDIALQHMMQVKTHHVIIFSAPSYPHAPTRATNTTCLYLTRTCARRSSAPPPTALVPLAAQQTAPLRRLLKHPCTRMLHL